MWTVAMALRLSGQGWWAERYLDMCACVSVLPRWLGESRAGWALIEARNNIKANLSILCLCLLNSPLHSVTHWLPHLSHHLDHVSASLSVFVRLSSLELALSTFLLYFLLIHFFFSQTFLRNARISKIDMQFRNMHRCIYSRYTHTVNLHHQSLHFFKDKQLSKASDDIQRFWKASLCLYVWVCLVNCIHDHIFVWLCIKTPLSKSNYFVLLVTNWKQMLCYCQSVVCASFECSPCY